MRPVIKPLGLALLCVLFACPALAEGTAALRSFELSDGRTVVGTVLDELETGYLVRTEDGETLRLRYSEVVSIAEVPTNELATGVVGPEAGGGESFPDASQLQVGFGALPWGLSPLEAKSTLEIRSPFVLARDWPGFTFSSEVGILIDRARLADWEGERALVFSQSGLTRVQVQFDASGALEPVRDWVSRSLGDAILRGDLGADHGPLKYTWFDGRVFLVRQPVQEGSYVALNVLAPPQLERSREERALRRQAESSETLAARARAQEMRDGGGGMIALGVIMQAAGVALAVTGVLEGKLELSAVGTALGLSGIPVIGIGIPVHVVGKVRHRNSYSGDS